MNRRILLLAIALAVCLGIGGCRRTPEQSSSPVISQVIVSESTSTIQLEPESSTASFSSQPLTFEEELAELKHGLSLTHPYSPKYGRMNNGFAGIQTQVYDEGNVHMEYPVLSDNRYIPDESPGKMDPNYFGDYPLIRECLNKDPFLFLKKYDLESEGTSLNLTYKVMDFDPSGIKLHYFGIYISEIGKEIPIHFISKFGCSSGPTESTEKYTGISNPRFVSDYIFDGGFYTIASDDPSKQQAAEEYIASMDPTWLSEFLYRLYFPDEPLHESIEKGVFPKGYYYSQNGKFITMIEVPEEYGYWITLTFDIEDLVNYSTMFGAMINPNWDGSSS